MKIFFFPAIFTCRVTVDLREYIIGQKLDFDSVILPPNEMVMKLYGNLGKQPDNRMLKSVHLLGFRRFAIMPIENGI
ncbi:MAG: hypothetical protein ABIU06_15330, partial [Anaerolineales bacterium]